MKAVISGYGKMGHMVESVLLKRGIPVAAVTEDVQSVPADVASQSVCIDFTTPDAFKANYRFLAKAFKAVVVGTTGWADIREDVVAAFEQAGTPMIYASNFSVGVNAVFAAVERLGVILKDQGYEPSIEEIHHIHKIDAPSGTAKSLGAIVEKTLGTAPPIDSIREGEVPGTHTVRFRSGADEIRLTHEAFSREGFAEGAVVAATLVEGTTGVHEFKDLLLGK